MIWQEPTARFGRTRLIGRALDVASPVRTASPTLYLDVALEEGGTVTVPRGATEEVAVYVAEGAVCVNEEDVMMMML